MTNFFNRSPKHQSHHYQPHQQDVTDISYSMENVSISSNAMMDIDTSYRSSKPTYNNPQQQQQQQQQQQAQNNLFNKENITPLNSPTKSILHNSPQQAKSSTSPQHLYNKLVNANYNGNSPQPGIQQQQNNRALQNNINQLQPPLNKRYKLTEAEFYAKANSARTKRLTSIAQLYFLDYYCDMFDYVINRRERTAIVEKNLLTDPMYKNDITKQQFEWKNYIGRERALLRKRRLKPKHKDFEMITQIGQGGYGQVFLSRKRDTREICALKILNKKLLIKLDETRHVLTERDILTNTRSDWLVKLLYAFQDQEKVFLAMEFVPGGDFRTLLNNTGYLIPPHARFYISEMFAAVNSLHELGFTHRDLKPENFLIDSKGHIKLTDFGLAAGTVCNDRIESMKIKLQNLQNLNDFNDDSNNDNHHYQVPSSLIYERQKIFKQSQQQQQQQNSNNTTANSIVGSPDYMALEVLEGKNYNYTIDYWSLGCMLFEALCGYPPFSGSKQDETYYNLKHWKTALRRPQTKDGRYVFSDRTWNLIIKLIASPNNRLQNFKQVQQQSYFSDIKDWGNLRQKTPPFTPQLDNEEDAGYFDDFEDDEMMMKYKDVFARQEQNEQLLEKSNTTTTTTTTTTTKNGKRFSPGSKFNDNFIGFTFKHKSNPNNKFTNGSGNTGRYGNGNGNNNNNGEINLLNMVENGIGNGNSRSSRLNPLATLY
ncbi:hypothetical protein MG5_02063 [Candida albicans P57072]|nr:hypothetical protein MG5_02063 [Candida albicans P57072]